MNAGPASRWVAAGAAALLAAVMAVGALVQREPYAPWDSDEDWETATHRHTAMEAIRTMTPWILVGLVVCAAVAFRPPTAPWGVSVGIVAMLTTLAAATIGEAAGRWDVFYGIGGSGRGRLPTEPTPAGRAFVLSMRTVFVCAVIATTWAWIAGRRPRVS